MDSRKVSELSLAELEAILETRRRTERARVKHQDVRVAQTSSHRRCRRTWHSALLLCVELTALSAFGVVLALILWNIQVLNQFGVTTRTEAIQAQEVSAQNNGGQTSQPVWHELPGSSFPPPDAYTRELPGSSIPPEETFPPALGVLGVRAQVAASL